MRTRWWLIGAVLVVMVAACTGETADPTTTTPATPTTAVTVNRSAGAALDAADDMAFALDGPVEIDVLANDSSGDPQSLTIVEVSPPTQGETSVVTFEFPPRIQFIPPPEGDWQDITFTYTVTDSSDATATATVIVTQPEGQLAAVDDRFELDLTQGDSMRLDVLNNDIGRFMNNARIESVGFVEGAETRAEQDSIDFRFQPDPAMPSPRSATFDYTLTNDLGAVSTATVIVAIAGFPEAVDDVVAVNQGFDVAIDVLANDINPSGDPSRLRIVEVGQPSQGEVVPGNPLVYRNDEADVTPTVTFTYTIATEENPSSQPLTDTGTVTILINRAPTAVDDEFAINEGAAEAIFAPLANDSDPDGDPLTIENIQAIGGDVRANPDGTITVALGPNPPPLIEARYLVADRGVPGGSVLADQAGIAISVNTVEPSPDFFEGAKGTTITLPVLDNDNDPEQDALAVTGVDHPGGSIGPDGLSFTVPETGCDVSFGYTVTDARGATDSSSVTVRIIDGEVPPTFSVPGLSTSDAAPAGTPIGTITAGGGCGANGPATYRISEGNDDGAFAIDPSTGRLTVADPSVLDADTAPQRPITIELTHEPFVVTTPATVEITDGSAPALNGVRLDAGFWVQPEDGTYFCLQAQEPGSIDNRGGFQTSQSAGTVTATDIDGDPLTFTLDDFDSEFVRLAVDSAVNAGAVNRPPDAELATSPLTIDPATGELRRSGPGEFLFWAYRTRAPFNYRITVSDGIFTTSGTLVVVVSESC